MVIPHVSQRSIGPRGPHPDGSAARARSYRPTVQAAARWAGRALTLTLATWLTAAPALAQSPRGLFTSAEARERQARAAMVAARTAPGVVLRAIRTAVSAYERAADIESPQGYADAALWSAAELAGDGYGAFGEERDRQTALRLARAILRHHPASVYAAKAADLVSRLSILRFGTPIAIHGIEQRAAPDGTELVIELAGPVWYRSVRLDSPPRIYYDLFNTRPAATLRGAARSFATGPVSGLRVGHHPHNTTRIVLEGDGVHGCAASLAMSPARIVVLCRGASAVPIPEPEWPSPRAIPSLIPDAWQTAAPPRLPARRFDDVASLIPAVASARLSGPGTYPGPVSLPAIDTADSTPGWGIPVPAGTDPSHPAAGSGDRSVVTPSTRVTVPDWANDARPDTRLDLGSASARTAPGENALWPSAEAAPEWERLEPDVAAGLETLPGRAAQPEGSPTEPPSSLGRALLVPSRRFTEHTNLTPAVQGPRLLSRPTGPSASSLPPAPLLFAPPLAPALGATRPTVQITAATQVLAGDEARIGGLGRLQPDVGVQFAYPGSRAGHLYADVNVTSRAGRPVVGRGLVRLSGFEAAGLTWSLDAGDTQAGPVTPDFGFSNLLAPPLNLRGVYVAGRAEHTSVTASAAHVTARRNIFGTESLPTGQQLVQVALSHRPDRFLEVFARASDVRGNSPLGYTALVDASTETGGGLRYRLAADWELIADVGYSTFRRTGSRRTEGEVSALLGTTWTGSRGWLQINASRLALGHYAVGSYPYNDRSSVFATGEWWPHDRLRLFAGTDLARSGLDPAAAEEATVALPPGTSTRSFGGARLQFGSWSTLGIRGEGGGRDVHASKFGGGFATDSGAISADWNLRVRGANALVRYERRANVDEGGVGAAFTQHEGSAQLFVSLGGSQIFAQGLFSQQVDQAGQGQTLWQASGGSQMSLGRVFVRAEGAFGHTRDWVTRQVVKRQSLSASASGRISGDTGFSVDVYLDHTPVELQAASPWAMRAMLRVTHAFSFGTSRTARAAGTAPYRGPTGKVAGVVFADWNGNGIADLDEDPVPGVRIVAGPASAAGNDAGRFMLDAIPTGEHQVTLDLATVPASFDPPPEPGRAVRVSTKTTSTVDFGLVPLGSIHGIVYQDLDGDGVLSAPDALIDGAVLVLDDHVRTEVTREGRFWFDNVRIGTHAVSLLLPSLPDGALLAGSNTAEAVLSRDEPVSQVTFVITMEKRQEIRKVFSPKKRN